MPRDEHSAWVMEDTRSTSVNRNFPPHLPSPPSMGKRSASSGLRKRRDRPRSLALASLICPGDTVPPAAPPPPPFTYLRPFCTWHVMLSRLLTDSYSPYKNSTRRREGVENKTHRAIADGPWRWLGQGGVTPQADAC